jgi:short-subunit dehydrogenase
MFGRTQVTGGSRGIGRAFAVELARWDIPVILVARDSTKLQELSKELRQCYGIPCCAIEVDLTAPGASERLHSATKAAGLDVDILINNAGVSSSGDFVNTPWEMIQNVMDLNTRSATHLCHLYGKDMQQRGRGRILMVSSLTGAFPGVPGSAVYAATKAYQRGFSCSLGKELERYGVGVTCLTPGAVKGTNFAQRGGMDNALCWKYPFYPTTAPQVVSRGVRAMLRGDPEVIPGLLNRVWLRVLQPLLPSRVSMLVAETSWKPLELSWPNINMSKKSGPKDNDGGFREQKAGAPHTPSPAKTTNNMQRYRSNFLAPDIILIDPSSESLDANEEETDYVEAEAMLKLTIDEGKDEGVERNGVDLYPYPKEGGAVEEEADDSLHDQKQHEGPSPSSKSMYGLNSEMSPQNGNGSLVSPDDCRSGQQTPENNPAVPRQSLHSDS